MQELYEGVVLLTVLLGCVYTEQLSWCEENELYLALFY
jgi:hypothetical protein